MTADDVFPWRMNVGVDLDMEATPLYKGGGTSRGIYRAYTAFGRELLFKWYDDNALAVFESSNLYHLYAWRRDLDSRERAELDSIGAFPLASVWIDERFSGVLIHPAPQRYMRLDRRGASTVVTADLLALRTERSAQLGVPHFPPPQKLAIVGKLIANLEFLHRHDLVVGDLQPQNLLVSTEPGAVDSYLIDCDSMWLHGRHALPPHDPPHWRVPGVRAFSPQSDLHKALLLGARALWEDVSYYDPDSPSFSGADAEHFRQFMFSDHVKVFEQVLGGAEPATDTAIHSAARVWRSLVRENGKMYVSTDDSVRKVWVEPGLASRKEQVAAAPDLSPEPAQPGVSRERPDWLRRRVADAPEVVRPSVPSGASSDPMPWALRLLGILVLVGVLGALVVAVIQLFIN